MGTDPEQALRIKAEEVSAWMLARHGWEFVTPLSLCMAGATPASTDAAQLLWLQEGPARAMGTVLLAQSRRGRTDHCHCAPAAGKVPGSLPFLTAGKSLLPQWAAPPERACASRRYHINPTDWEGN